MAKNIQIGQAGVHRVIAELILRGHMPFVPSFDDRGVDLMLSTGVRIQVKTATLHERDNSAGRREAYFFSLGWTAMGRDQRPIRRKRKYSDECDFVVFVGITEGRFWIVPSFMVDGRQCLELGPRSRVSVNEVASLLTSNGGGVLSAASTLGVSRTTVWRRKQGDIKRGGFVKAVRQCEGRWEFLDAPVIVTRPETKGAAAEVAELEALASK